MGVSRLSKLAAGIIFVLSAIGVASPIPLIPLGLAVWVLGEAL